jgi:hypothetical protein
VVEDGDPDGQHVRQLLCGDAVRWHCGGSMYSAVVSLGNYYAEAIALRPIGISKGRRMKNWNVEI